MRHWLIFLLCAAGVLFASPIFWWLVQSETGAAPVTIIEADGVSRVNVLGPKAPWPDWVPLPTDGRLTVRTWYADAPGHPGLGFGDVALARPMRDEIASLAAQLRGEGWDVTTALFHGSTADLPPVPLTLCFVRAERADPQRTLVYNFQLAPAAKDLRVHWTNGPPLPGWRRPDGPPC